MATTVASVSSVPLQTQTVAASTRTTGATGTAEPFQTALAQATAESRATQATKEASEAASDAKTEALAEDKKTADARAAELAAQLAAQLAPTDTPLTPAQLAILTPGQVPVPTDAQSETAPGFATAPTVPTQTNPLFRQFVSESAAQNNTRLTASVTKTTTPAPTTPDKTNAAATTALPQSTLAEPTTPLPATTGLAAAVAAAQPGQRQVVPLLSPLVTGVGQTQPEIGATALPTPVVAPTAPTEAPAVPSVVLGDRPGTAGQQFAAIASAAAQLVPNAPPPAPTTAFATVLAPEIAKLPVANPVAANPPITDLPNAALGNITFESSRLANTNVGDATLASTLVANATAAAQIAAPAQLAPTQLAPATEPVVKDRDLGDPVPATGFGSPYSNAAPTNAPSAPLAPTALRAPEPVVQVADGIVTHARTVQTGETTEFQIRLDPPELGPVRIRLTSDGDGINGQVMVSNDAIRRMIESQLPELRQRLEAAGVTVQNFDVATDSGTGFGANTNDGSNAFRPDPLAEFARQAVATGPVPRPTAAPRGAGVLDVMA